MKNDYEIRGDVTAIIINSKKYGRLETLISTSKLERAKEFINSWHVSICKNSKISFYVLGALSKNNGKQPSIGLHRWITNTPKGMVVDHINHNTLDNTDNNLRILTQAENSQNRRGARINSTSGIRGVRWREKQKKWEGRVMIHGEMIHAGSFETIEEATAATELIRSQMMPFSLEALGEKRY